MVTHIDRYFEIILIIGLCLLIKKEVKTMDIIENITESLKYPLSDWTKILVLAVISIIPIVNFISEGYMLRVIKSTLAGIDEIPDFDN